MRTKKRKGDGIDALEKSGGTDCAFGDRNGNAMLWSFTRRGGDRSEQGN